MKRRDSKPVPYLFVCCPRCQRTLKVEFGWPRPSLQQLRNVRDHALRAHVCQPKPADAKFFTEEGK